MTIDDLIRELEHYREELGGESEVRLMTQKQWPFENKIEGVADLADIQVAEEDEDVEGFDPAGDTETVLYLVEGEQLGYGSKAAWNVIR